MVEKVSEGCISLDLKQPINSDNSCQCCGWDANKAYTP